MAISGRVPLLLLLGLVPVVLRPSFGHDVALAAARGAARRSRRAARRPSPSALEFSRRPTCAGAARATRRRRPWWSPTPRAAPSRGLLRDAWQPTAGATGNRYPLRLTPGDRVLLHTPAPARTPRRPAGRTASPSAPAGRSAWPPASARSRCRARCGRCRRSSRASTCLRGWPACASSTVDRRCGSGARAPSSTRCASTSAATTCAPSTGGPRARNRNVVVRTWQPERDRRVVLVLDTSRTSAGRVDDVPRLDSAMDAALLLAALAARAGDRIDFLAGDRRVRARLRSAGARDVAATLQDTMADLQPVIAEADWAGPGRRGHRAWTPAGAGRAADPAGAVGRRGRPAAGAADADQAPPGGARLGQGPRPRPARRPPRRHRGGLRRRRRRAGARPAPSAPPTCCAPWASTSSTPTAEQLPPALADHYLALKARGLL